jgi:hypothetical protein
LAAFNDDHDHLIEYPNEYKDASTFTSPDIMQPDNSNDDVITSLLLTLETREEELSAVTQERDSLSEELAKVKAQEGNRLDAAYHNQVQDFNDTEVRGLLSQLAKERERANICQAELNLKDPIYQDGVRMRIGQLERARRVHRRKRTSNVRGQPDKKAIKDRNITAHHWNVESFKNMFELEEFKSMVDKRLFEVLSGVPLADILPSSKFKKAINMHGTMAATCFSWTRFTHDAEEEKRFKALFNHCLRIRDEAMRATGNDKNQAAKIIDTNGLIDSKLKQMETIVAQFETWEREAQNGKKNGEQHGN